MPAVHAAKLLYSLAGVTRVTTISAGDGVFVRTVDSGDKFEKAIVLGVNVPENQDDGVTVRVLWCWELSEVLPELRAHAVALGANAIRDVLLPVSKPYAYKTVPLESIAFDRFFPHFACEAEALPIVGSGFPTVRVFGFLKHVRSGGMILEKFLADDDTGPRKGAPDIFEWCRSHAPGFVSSSSAEDLAAIRASGTRVAKGMPYIDLRPAARLGEPCAVASSLDDGHDPVDMDDDDDDDDAADEAPATVYACTALVPPLGSGEAYLADEGCLRLPAAAAGDAREPGNRRKRARSAAAQCAAGDGGDGGDEDSGDEGLGYGERAEVDFAFNTVPPPKGCPVKAWDARLKEVSARPPTFFHWEMAKLAAPTAYEIGGFATNTWSVRCSERYHEVRAGHFYNVFFRDIVRQVAAAARAPGATVHCSATCPPSFAAFAVNELGQFWSSRQNMNHLRLAGVAAAKPTTQISEVRMNAKDLGNFLGYGGLSAHFDGRIHLSRRYTEKTWRHVFFNLLPVGRKLNDGTEQVAAVEYDAATETLSLRLRLFAACERRMRYTPGEGMPMRCAMDLDDLVRSEM